MWHARICLLYAYCILIPKYVSLWKKTQESSDPNFEEDTTSGELNFGDSPFSFSQETLEKLALNPDIEVNIEVVNENDSWNSDKNNNNEKRDSVNSITESSLQYSGDEESTFDSKGLNSGNDYFYTKFANKKKQNQPSELHDLLEETKGDLCEKWIKCRNEFLAAYLRQLSHLPSCPCLYPMNIVYNDTIWDEVTSRYVRWRDSSGLSEKLPVYKVGASYCIRSLVGNGKTGLAAQHCCYDNDRKIITRGRAAGTPNLVSPDVSKRLHYEVDIRPWIMCKGDWTRYNKARPPDNRMNCTENPNVQEYNRQIKQAKWY